MFSDNNRISLRQTKRLFTFNLLGVGTLLLPPVLAAYCGIWGIVCLLVGGLMALLYIALLKKSVSVMNTDIISYISSKGNKIVIVSFLLFFMLYSVLTAGFCANIFAVLIKKELVPQESYILILLVILVVASYAVSGGVESRARVYEVLFWFVIIPLAIMLTFAARDIDINYLKPVQSLDIISIARGSYLVFFSFIPLFNMLTFVDSVGLEQRQKVVNSVTKAFFITELIEIAAYLVLIGTFGGPSLATMKYPIVTLMSTVQIKGNFLKRTDAFMLGVWFFTLFAFLNLNLFYGVKVAQRIVKKRGRIKYIVVMAIFVMMTSLYFNYGRFEMKYIKLMEYVCVPVLVLIPFLIILTGCGSAELENRCFPMLAAVDKAEESVEFVYIFPQAGLKSDNAQASDNVNLPPVKGNDFETARTKYENNLSKLADKNHLKVFIMGSEYVKEKDLYNKMLDELKRDESFPRNTYVCVTENIDKMLDLRETITTDLGSYLEEFLENHEENMEYKLVNLGQLIDEKENATQEIMLPLLQIQNETIVWNDYFLLNP